VLRHIPLINSAVCLLLLTNSQLGQICLDLTKLGGETLVLTGLDIKIGLHFVVDFRFDELISLFDQVTNIARNKLSVSKYNI